MDIFDQLTKLLETYYSSESKVGFKNIGLKNLKVTMKGNSITGDSCEKDLTINESEAKELYDLLFKGSIVSRFGGKEGFTTGISLDNKYGIEFYIDGRRVSSDEINSLYNEAIKNFTQQYNELINDLIKLKTETVTLSSQFKRNNRYISDNKEHLKSILESEKNRMSTDGMSFHATIPMYEDRNQEEPKLSDVLEYSKQNNNLKLVETQIVEVINKIMDGDFITSSLLLPGYAHESNSFTDISDKLIYMELLNILKEKVTSINEELVKAITEQNIEIEKLVNTFAKVRETATIGMTSKGKVEDAISQNNVDINSTIERPAPEVSELANEAYNNQFISQSSIPVFRYDSQRNKSEIDSLDKKQMEELSYDEKIAINLYKSQLYRGFNGLMRYMKNNGYSMEQPVINEETEKILHEAYEEIHERYVNPDPMAMLQVPNKEYVANDYFDRFFGQNGPTYEQYKNAVLRYYVPLMSSLSKVTLEDDLVVYRGVSSGNLDMSGIISTTLDPQVSSKFRERDPNSERKSVIRFTIPKGSPVIAFTNNLMKVHTGEYTDNLTEEQKEIAFNSELYDVVDYKQTQEPIIDQNGNQTFITYFDVTLRPKVNVLQQEQSSTQR